MIIKNYTGKDIIMSNWGEDLAEIKAEDTTPKIIVSRNLTFPMDFITTDGQEFHAGIVLSRSHKVLDLPEEEPGTMFVVPLPVLDLCGEDRTDLIAINEVEPDENGDTRKVHNFKRYIHKEAIK